MIHRWTSSDRSAIRQLFEPFDKARALILPAIDQNRCELWVDSLEFPSAAMWRLKNLCALAGDSTSPSAYELISKIEPRQAVFVCSEDWTDLLKSSWGSRLGSQKRTRLSPDTLDIDHLRKLMQTVPEDFVLERMDLDTVKSLDKRVAMHIPLFYGDSESFYNNGVGFCIKHQGKVVSSASSFAPFTDAFEIEVYTSNDPIYRRKGLATAVCAALIVYALERKLVPHWDAANEGSIALALKLGYTNPEPWEIFYLHPES
ncbi:MAG: hypothetical protein BV458_09430 [Thermoplasmata archaeon M9B2D]|nr:MAG: hypothetical protein BV458_09430 [Thermoplasmata archaeon M9B2D]